jgi:hypothetical protein
MDVGARATRWAGLVASAIAIAACASCAASQPPRACAPGLAVLDGACVAPRDVAAYCGGSCAPVRCDGAGEAVDLQRRACVPALTVRAIASRERSLPDDARLACRGDGVLVATDDRVVCLPRSSTCPRGAPWEEAHRACVTPALCPPGSLRSAAACIDVVREGRVVDVGRWARAALGDDGGPGSPRVCGPLAASPWIFDVGSGGTREVALSVELVFRDNDVTLVSSRVTGRDVPAVGVALADRTVASLLPALRALGGTTDAASVTTRVTCTVRGGGAPMILPTSP